MVFPSPSFPLLGVLIFAMACGGREHVDVPYPHELLDPGAPPPPADPEAARAAAVAGDADALASLQSVPNYGSGHPLDGIDADLAESARMGSVPSHNLLARRVADGVPSAQFAYAGLLLSGVPALGLSPALAEGVAYLTRAAAGDDPGARYALCQGYLRGFRVGGELVTGHVEAQTEDAFNICSELALTGHHGALVTMGDIYRYGLAGRETDAARAFEWYEIGATSVPPSPEALLALSDLYMDPVEGGPEQDFQEAVRLLYLAVGSGSTEATLRLAAFFEGGPPGLRDPEAALRIWSHASDSGLVVASWGLARSFACAIGTGPSQVEHEYWLGRAREASGGSDPFGYTAGELVYGIGCALLTPSMVRFQQ